MKAEIIFIGTELLLGQILNSNAVFLSQELNFLGIDCHFQTIVGDNKKRIQEAVQIALQRSTDFIITTGGLGPTSDDLTHESLAELFNEELKLDQKVLNHIEELFKKRNKIMTTSNAKQAYRPASADLLFNSVGTAPGIIWNISSKCQSPNNTIILTFPGVPREMQTMWKEVAKPFLAKKTTGGQVLVYKELKFYGIGESALAEKVQDLLDLDDPTIAPLAGKAECRLRLATKAQNQAQGLEKLKPIEDKIFARVGEFIYGFDDQTLEMVVAEKLKSQNLTLAIAESCTGGLLSKRLTDLAGSSAYTKMNIITYSNESKNEILKVELSALNSFGAVSEEVALQMAEGIKQLAKTDIGLSITGIAGPEGGSPEKPIGRVYIAISYKNLKQAQKFDFGHGTRSDIRWLASQEALNYLRKVL